MQKGRDRRFFLHNRYILIRVYRNHSYYVSNKLISPFFFNNGHIYRTDVCCYFGEYAPITYWQCYCIIAITKIPEHCYI